MVVVLCTLSDDALYVYMYQVSRKYLESFGKTDLNIRVNARMVTNADGRTNKLM